MSAKIVHPIEPETWPTREEAARARWFTPVDLGRGCVLTTRTWVPAMVPWRATEHGEVTEEVLGWYARFAQGRPGAIVVEATGIRDVPSGPLLRIGDDRFLDGLARLVDTVRTHSGGETRLFIQLIDFLTIRRRPEPETFFMRYLAITPSHREALCALTGSEHFLTAPESEVRAALAVRAASHARELLTLREYESLTMGYRERGTDTHLPHIRELPRVLPDLFARAAERAQRAGFDGVELHYAHAYTMASFLSARNDRDDGYGRSREGRARLPLEVLAAVRSAVRERFVVGCRMLGDEAIEHGSTIEDAVDYAVRFARAGMDFISVSKGGKFEDAKPPRVGEAAYPYTGPSGHECMPTVRIDARGPFGRNLHLARDVKHALREQQLNTPVIAAGGINGFAQAEAALERGDADIIASARQALADPDWWRKIREGRGDEIRRCKFTNYCEALDQLHEQVTCQLWDKIRSNDPDALTALRTKDGRRRLVAPPWT